jgi:hypothetical protein
MDILLKILKMKLYKNPSCGGRAVPYGETDGTEVSSLFASGLKASKNVLF